MILGTFRYGRVDRVPGRFYVATQFLQFCFVPLIPLQSYVIKGEEFEKFQGIPIPMSLKSVFMTWGRTILFLYVATTLWKMWNAGFTESQLMWTGGAVVLFVLSLFYLPRASFTRAVQLGLAAEIPPEEIAAQFGRELPTAETLEQLQSELRPKSIEGQPGVGLAGKLFSGLLTFLPGAWLTYYSIRELLKSGRKGYGASFMISLLMLLGLGLSIAGLSCWIEWSKQIRNNLYLAALALIALAALSGPTLSNWWLQR